MRGTNECNFTKSAFEPDHLVGFFMSGVGSRVSLLLRRETHTSKPQY